MSKLADIFRPRGQEADGGGVVVPMPRASARAKGAGLPTAGAPVRDEAVRDDNAARDLAVQQEVAVPRRDDAAPHRSEEGEALHRLLVDTSRKINDLDSLKSALDDMTLPFRGAMRALDQERALSSNLSRQLGEKAAICDKLRDELQEAENRTRVLETEAESLRDALDQARESSYAVESARALLGDEIKRRDEKIAALERQLEQEAAQRRTFGDSFRAMQEQAFHAETRLSEMQDALVEAEQACEGLKQDKRSLWRSAELAREEAERMSRRVAEGEHMLSAIRLELGKVEARHVETSAERNRLTDTVDELREQVEAERQRFSGRLDALEARAAAAERAVAETRQRLIDRTEEARAFVCKAAEATIARAAAERKLAALQVAQGIRAHGDDDPMESRTALSEYLRALNLKSREMALAGSAEKLAALTERKRIQAADSESPRVGNGIEDVMAALASSGRQPRSDIEDALDAARKANARLESEVASLRSGLSDVGGRPAIAMPGKTETAPSQAELSKMELRERANAARAKPERLRPERAKPEGPKSERVLPEPRQSRTGSASKGGLAYEAGLTAQLRGSSEEGDTPRSVA